MFRSLVLCYHTVSETWSDPLALRPSMLEAHLSGLLKRGYLPVDASRVLSGTRKLLHVTFDDAFKSVAAAVPILQRRSVPFTVFVCAQYADDGRPLVIPELADQAKTHLLTLTWSDLRDLAAEDGAEVGSHTLSHPRLSHLTDEELDHELRFSRERIEDELGRPCRFLSYPYGDEEPRIHAAARAAGYQAAFALPGKPRPFNTFAVPRVGIWRGDGVLRAMIKTFPIVRQTAPSLLAALPPAATRRIRREVQRSGAH